MIFLGFSFYNVKLEFSIVNILSSLEDNDFTTKTLHKIYYFLPWLIQDLLWKKKLLVFQRKIWENIRKKNPKVRFKLRFINVII